MKEKRAKILKEALKLAPFDGWNKQTLSNAAAKAGFAPEYSQIAFPGGAKDAIDFFLRDLDQQMLDKLSKTGLESLKIRDRITLAVRTRIELLEKHRLAMRGIISFYSSPLNCSCTLPSLWKTVDSIWVAAGDTATDFNHYTKRITLAGVYSSTLLYWLKDESKDYQASWDFLSRRINNVMQINKAKAKLSGFFSRAKI